MDSIAHVHITHLQAGCKPIPYEICIRSFLDVERQQDTNVDRSNQREKVKHTVKELITIENDQHRFKIIWKSVIL